MAERTLPHIFVEGRVDVDPYRPPPRPITSKPRPAPANRSEHGQQLTRSLTDEEARGRARRQAQNLVIEGATEGIYLTFASFPGLDLALESLDPRQGKVHPHLVSVRTTETDEGPVEEATVFVPDGKLGYFLKRANEYVQSSQEDKPKHAKLIDPIRQIGLSSLEQLWTDRAADFPQTDAPVWWEVWLRRSDGLELNRLRHFADHSGFTLRGRALIFTDRIVVLLHAPRNGLAIALDVLNDLAELRRPRSHAELIATEPAVEQSDWVDDLARRTDGPPPAAPAACILDTGVDRGHPLLSPALTPADCHACDPKWRTDDHDGHGTEMAGLALYGDLEEAVSTPMRVHLRHRLESVKILPRSGQNDEDLYGAITANAASRVEITEPKRRRVFSLAVTAEDRGHAGDAPILAGQPSSWSTVLDALSVGHAVDTSEEGITYIDRDAPGPARLFVVAAGNVRTNSGDHLTRSDLEVVEDPAQSWNALTVGAFTNLVEIDPSETGHGGWTPVAARGELSPCSRTSVAFDRAWPIKPDVVFEGGNVARSPDGTEYDTPYSHQLLTTKRRALDARAFTVTGQTSAATAQAAHLAASILAEFPTLWPETVRALIVHSAEWTPAMRSHFEGEKNLTPRAALLRRYGMGVPSFTRATRSASDALTLVAQDIIHPFDNGKMHQINIHALPWPVDQLEDLGETQVRLRVTLSYFIEPNPGSRGWVRRYSYASHGLRFDVRRPTESNERFRKRLNQLALAEQEKRPTSVGESGEWLFGAKTRTAGSLHTDIWRGTAADLASRGAIAVYPVTGWWKELKARDRSGEGARYALVVSIETPDQDVDIWTPVAQRVGVAVPIDVG